MSWLWRTAKGQLLLIFGVLLALAVPGAGGQAVLPTLVAAVVTLQRPHPRLDLDLIVHERKEPIELTAVEELIHEQDQVHILG